MKQLIESGIASESKLTSSLRYAFYHTRNHFILFPLLDFCRIFTSQARRKPYRHIENNQTNSNWIKHFDTFIIQQ